LRSLARLISLRRLGLERSRNARGCNIGVQLFDCTRSRVEVSKETLVGEVIDAGMTALVATGAVPGAALCASREGGLGLGIGDGTNKVTTDNAQVRLHLL
jgi:hypothetical protein